MRFVCPTLVQQLVMEKYSVAGNWVLYHEPKTGSVITGVITANNDREFRKSYSYDDFDWDSCGFYCKTWNQIKGHWSEKNKKWRRKKNCWGGGWYAHYSEFVDLTLDVQVCRIQRMWRRAIIRKRWKIVMGELEALPGAAGYNEAYDQWVRLTARVY